MNTDVTYGLREKAKALLNDKKVVCVLGYEKGSDEICARPVFIKDSKDVSKLIFDNTCNHNLSTYLRGLKGKKVAITVKACDVRSIQILVKENQIDRKDLILLGVTCPGMVECSWSSVSDTLRKQCQICEQKYPTDCDEVFGASMVEACNPDFSEILEMESKTQEEKFLFWQQQSQACLRCQACRQVCPLCYCSDCFSESLCPEWLGIQINSQQAFEWLAIRAFHMVGRCVGCGQCERVCPAHIPLRLLYRKMEKDLMERFDYRSGKDAQQMNPIDDYNINDKDETKK